MKNHNFNIFGGWFFLMDRPGNQQGPRNFGKLKPEPKEKVMKILIKIRLVLIEFVAVLLFAGLRPAGGRWVGSLCGASLWEVFVELLCGASWRTVFVELLSEVELMLSELYHPEEL